MLAFLGVKLKIFKRTLMVMWCNHQIKYLNTCECAHLNCFQNKINYLNLNFV